MARKGSHTVLEDVRTAWTLLGDSFCLWVENLDPELMFEEPLQLADGRQVQVGDQVTRLGGKKRSAGWTIVDMLPGEFLTYHGKARSLDGTLALFKTKKPMKAFVAYLIHTDTLFHFTPACSGRAVETTGWIFTTPEGIAKA